MVFNILGSGIPRQGRRAMVGNHGEIPTNKGDNIMRQVKYDYDKDVFNSVNEKSAYWIGFIISDGYMNGNRLAIALSEKDIDLLRQFKDFIRSPKRPIRKFISNRNYPSAEIRVRSWDYKKALDKYGMNLLKKDRSYVPIELLQDDIRRHFLRGIFDADGSYYIDTRGYMFAEITGYKRMLKIVKQILVSDKIISEKKKITKNGKIFRIRLSAQDAIKLGEYLYKGYPNIYCSHRKHNIYQAHVERLNNTTEHPRYALKRQSKKISDQSKTGTKASKKNLK